MRFLLPIAILALVGCRATDRSLEENLRTTRDLIAKEQYNAALPKAEEGAQEAERSGKLNYAWRFRLLKVEVLVQRGLAKEALAALDQYGDVPTGQEWAEQRGRALMFRAVALNRFSKLTESQEYFERADEAARQAGSQSLTAELDMRRGNLLTMQNRFDEARDVLRRALDGATAQNEKLLAAKALGSIGYTLLSESRYDEAIPWFERSKALFSALGAPDSVALSDGNLASCFAYLGDNENAVQHYELARAQFGRSGNRFQEQIFTGGAGRLYMENKNFTAAAAAFKSAMETARQISNPVWTARWLSNLAITSIQTRDWDSAEKYNQEALRLKLELKDTQYESSSLLNAAQIAVGREQFAAAESLFRQVLSKQAQNPTVPLDAHRGLAELYIRKGAKSAADAEFRTTLAQIDQRGLNLNKDEYKLAYLDGLVQFHRAYVDFLMTDGQTDRALQVAESSRARVLAGKSGRSETLAIVPAQQYRRLAQRAQAALLEYWLGDERSYLWVITPEQIRVHTLPGSASIRPLIENYRAVVMAGRDPLQVSGDTGRKLYDMLVKPATEDVPKTTRFVIVPDGVLHAFNFESLPANGDGKYWIEQATVSIAPSLQYMAARSSSHAKPDLLVVGDAESREAQYPRLQFAGQEMDSIASSMKPISGSTPKVLRGAAAQPGAYVEAHPGQFGFIHFSAHAAANEKSPLDSAVILSGPSDKSRLLARDVMNIPLSAQLVTISACRSAGGKTYAGEGLVGFAWAFLRAGAGNVIAGLWDVDDRSTEEIMTRLYQQIAKRTAIPDALREAKLSLIRAGGAYAKPYYWAPFQLYAGVAQ